MNNTKRCAYCGRKNWPDSLMNFLWTALAFGFMLFLIYFLGE